MSTKEKPFWPDDSDLVVLQREANEHRRAWGLVQGLSIALRKERWSTPPKPSEEAQNQRIHDLEMKIVAQKVALTNLEACRAFEAGTEALLVNLAYELSAQLADPKGPTRSKLGRRAVEVLEEYAQRKGPRPDNDG
jgi:hypothetical protein